jgi:hypothetical protein
MGRAKAPEIQLDPAVDIGAADFLAALEIETEPALSYGHARGTITVSDGNLGNIHGDDIIVVELDIEQNESVRLYRSLTSTRKGRER